MHSCKEFQSASQHGWPQFLSFFSLLGLFLFDSGAAVYLILCVFMAWVPFVAFFFGFLFFLSWVRAGFCLHVLGSAFFLWR